MKGVRVKITFNFSAIRTCTPLFITVTGLNDYNLYGNKTC